MTTEERFVKLEQELSSAKNHIHRLVVAVIIAVVMVVVWTYSSKTNTAQAEGVSDIPSVIRARKFILEDNNGKVRAVLSNTEEEGTGLAILDRSGKTSIKLGTNKLANVLLISDQNDKPSIVLSTTELGNTLFISDQNSKLRAAMGFISDQNGILRSAAMGMMENTPVLAVYDEHERVIWSTESPPEQKKQSSESTLEQKKQSSDVIATFSGSGGKNTRPFSVPAGWEIQWDAKGDIFQLFLYEADGSIVGVPANQEGSGKGSSYQAKAGTYYLQVNALDEWIIKIVKLK
jgi:hypothetical protein